MMALIAVEEGLGNIQKALKEAGHQVVELDPENQRRAHVIVVSGVDHNMLQQEDIRTTVPVINASGYTPEEVVEAVHQHLV